MGTFAFAECPATPVGWQRFGTTCCNSGGERSCAAVSDIACRGIAWSATPAGFHLLETTVLGQIAALTSPLKARAVCGNAALHGSVEGSRAIAVPTLTDPVLSVRDPIET